jgi:hypothetical protein
MKQKNKRNDRDGKLERDDKLFIERRRSSTQSLASFENERVSDNATTRDRCLDSSVLEVYSTRGAQADALGFVFMSCAPMLNVKCPNLVKSPSKEI